MSTMPRLRGQIQCWTHHSICGQSTSATALHEHRACNLFFPAFLPDRTPNSVPDMYEVTDKGELIKSK